LENCVEDPLSEELLKGEFQGKDTITVRVKEVADRKQLYFEGSIKGGENNTVPVGAATDDSAASKA